MSQFKLPFKLENSYEKRKKLSSKILLTYPDRIPVIIEPHKDIDPKISFSK